MKPSISRRDLLRALAAAGLTSALARRSVADEPAGGPAPRKTPELKLVPVTPRDRYPAELMSGKVVQPERPLPVIRETDVLVVGGGAAGFAAAVAAARAGVRTTIVERYGCFGGLWTGGLVLVVISTHALEGGRKVKVLGGIGDELLQRHAGVPGAIINHEPGRHNPTTDPEATKFFMDDMIAASGADVLLHVWAADVVMEAGAVRGVVLESKAGRQAILAKVVVDATGDGDVFAAAGAEHEQRLHAIGLVHRLGNVDRADAAKLKAAGVGGLGAAEPIAGVKWVNLRGPSTDALDVTELTRLEMEHRRAIWQRVQKLRCTPGGESVFLLQTAPQLGVRTTRILAGTHRLTGEEAKASTTFRDVVGVGGAQGANHAGWPIPYGVLLPKTLDGLLAAGRCISADETLIEDTRLIAPCLTTGHAAGAAAAVAVQSRCRPRDVEVGRVQELLKAQGAYLG